MIRRSSPITAAGPRWNCTTFPLGPAGPDTDDRNRFSCQTPRLTSTRRDPCTRLKTVRQHNNKKIVPLRIGYRFSQAARAKSEAPAESETPVRERSSVPKVSSNRPLPHGRGSVWPTHRTTCNVTLGPPSRSASPTIGAPAIGTPRDWRPPKFARPTPLARPLRILHPHPLRRRRRTPSPGRRVAPLHPRRSRPQRPQPCPSESTAIRPRSA